MKWIIKQFHMKDLQDGTFQNWMNELERKFDLVELVQLTPIGDKSIVACIKVHTNEAPVKPA
jgi:hypothetical protein